MWLLLPLLIIGYIDWKHRRIPNGYLLGLLVIGVCSNIELVSNDLTSLVINIIIALSLTLPGYIKGVLGGGDVKLMLTLVFCYTPWQLLLVFSIGIGSLLLLMTAQHFAQQMSLTKAYCPNFAARPSGFQRGLPLGTAMALGAIALRLIIGF